MADRNAKEDERARNGAKEQIPGEEDPLDAPKKLKTLGNGGAKQDETPNADNENPPTKPRYTDGSAVIYSLEDEDEWDDEDHEDDWDEDGDDDLDACEIVEGLPEELAEASMFAWFDISLYLRETGAWVTTPSGMTILELSQEELDIVGGPKAIDAFRDRLTSDLRRLDLRRSLSAVPKDLWLIMVRLYMILKWQEETRLVNEKPQLDPSLPDSILDNWFMRNFTSTHIGQLKIMTAMLFDTCAEEGKTFPYQGNLLGRRYDFRGVKIGAANKWSSPKAQTAEGSSPDKASGESSGEHSSGPSAEPSGGPQGIDTAPGESRARSLVRLLEDKSQDGMDKTDETEETPAARDEDRSPLAAQAGERARPETDTPAQTGARDQGPSTEAIGGQPGTNGREIAPAKNKPATNKAQKPRPVKQAPKQPPKSRTPFVPTITPPFNPERPTAEGIQELFRLSNCDEDYFAYRVGVGKATAARWLEVKGNIYLTKESLKKVSKYQQKLLKKIAEGK